MAGPLSPCSARRVWKTTCVMPCRHYYIILYHIMSLLHSMIYRHTKSCRLRAVARLLRSTSATESAWSRRVLCDAMAYC